MLLKKGINIILIFILLIFLLALLDKIGYIIKINLPNFKKDNYWLYHYIVRKTLLDYIKSAFYFSLIMYIPFLFINLLFNKKSNNAFPFISAGIIFLVLAFYGLTVPTSWSGSSEIKITLPTFISLLSFFIAAMAMAGLYVWFILKNFKK